MTNRQLEKLKKETQEQVDQIVPGKVEVRIEKDGEDRGGNTYILIGEYYNPAYGAAVWTERIDNFFTMTLLTFVTLFSYGKIFCTI